jgi:transcriptional regulator GlxA family with amidase domain
MAGNFECDAGHEDLIARLIPPVVHVRGHEVSAGRLGDLLRLIGDEAMTERPGRSLILGRLLETLLVEALRSGSAPLAKDGQGLMAGLAEPRIGQALQLLHQDAAKPWTVAHLARAVGMSRSALAERFTRTVGLPPMDYLARWRMTLARNALTSSGLSMNDIAEMAGYQSVSAFSTAFRRVNGVSPTAYVRDRQTDAGPGYTMI